MEAVRYFWTVQDVEPVVEHHSAGDIVLNSDSERYRGFGLSQKWGSVQLNPLAVRAGGASDEPST